MASPATTRLRRVALATLVVAAFAVSFAPGAASAAPSASDLQQQIDAKGKQLNAVIQQWDGLNDQLIKTTAQARDVQTRLAPLQARLATADAAVARLSTDSYEAGDLGGFTALITAGSPDSLIERLSLLENLGADRQQELAGYRAASDQLSAEQGHFDQLLAQQRVQKATLDVRKVKIQAEIDALQKQRDQLGAQTGTTSAGTGSTVVTAAPAASAKAQIAVNAALAQVGKPYVFGAAGPDSFDCSGLTQWAWAKAGVALSHYTFTQMNNDTTPISRSQLLPGDLVFFYGGDHVGLYIGNNRVVHAPQPGESVKVSDIDWMNGYYAAGRPG